MLARYRDVYCTFNDDIQGTASVAVAGILSAIRLTGKQLTENKFLFYGAGEVSLGWTGIGHDLDSSLIQASIGISDLLTLALQREGLSIEDARKRIFLVDSKGLVVKVVRGRVSLLEVGFRSSRLEPTHRWLERREETLCPRP